jgi:hypothetical protein
MGLAATRTPFPLQKGYYPCIFRSIGLELLTVLQATGNIISLYHNFCNLPLFRIGYKIAEDNIFSHAFRLVKKMVEKYKQKADNKPEYNVLL